MPICSGCIAAGVHVRTPAGERPIESLSIGERVVSYDEKTGRPSEARVLRRLDHGEAPTLSFRLADGRTLLVTAVHPLYDPDARSYRAAASWSVGERLSVATAEGLAPAAIVAIEPGPRRRVFDITVDGPFENFLAAGVLVHNKPKTK
ncbi:MAG: hypothetical protein HY613_07365 [Candidatus Rokubacteria bacterium]|nr:hypothetical protein [Candidatus Rokubacteria bacterium]